MTRTDNPTARLVKTGLPENLAKYIAGKGIRSAVQLANMTVGDIRDLLRDVDLQGDNIHAIKKRATAMKVLIDNHLATVRGQVSPVYKALASTNTNNNIINFHEGMESYPEMFGNLDYAPDAEFDSMISPAAYLVDLMRYIDEYIVQPANEEDKPLLLQSRRPDIWNIPLTTENTVSEIPYLQLVNEILKAKLDAEGKVMPDGTIDDFDRVGNALQYMAETIFPFNLPFNAPLEQIRKYLQALDTELYNIYKTFHIDPRAQTREYLELSPAQTAYLTTPLVNKDSLNLAYGNIRTDTPRPHFTGIEDDHNLGSLTNAEIFMNQVGFTQTSQLETLFYQNINRQLPGANDLLNNLFINKSSGGYHLAYSAAETTGPDWANEEVWEDPSYYSTIQRVVAGGKLYLLVRTKNGIDTWQYNNVHKNWVQLAKASPAWSDDDDWDQEMYYSTICCVATDDPLHTSALYLFGRYKDGIHTWLFDTVTNTWTAVKNSPLWPDWTDTNWDQPEYYRTIKAVAIGTKIFLLGRQSDGITTWYLDTISHKWAPFIAAANPDFTDTLGWNVPACYLTIQAIAYNGQLFLIGRSNRGIETYALYIKDDIVTGWFKAPLPYPDWSTDNKWDQPCYYLTIQLFKADGGLYLLGSGPDGIVLCILEVLAFDAFSWVWRITLAVPNWSVVDWQETANYLTIKAFALGKNIGLIGRSATGIQTWELIIPGITWTQLETNSPAWSDATGWNDPSYYTSIQPVKFDNSILLTGTTKTGIDTWRFDTTKNIWVKDKLVKAVIELENNSDYTNLIMAVLDRLNRFIRLSNSLQWQPEDLDWALTAAAAGDISTEAIDDLKNLQWIIDTLQLPLWQATAFWHDIKTYGEGNGPVSQAPFDIVFNQPMPFYQGSLVTLNDTASKLYHPLYQSNPNYRDEPLIWQTDGKTALSYSIIIRLMAALKLDARNLKALIDHLKGTNVYSNGNQIVLGVENLSVLYRYGLLANSLKLSVPELVILLEFLHLEKPLLFGSDDLVRIITCNQWMVENKLNVYQLNYICHAAGSKFVDTGFDLEKVPDLLKSLSEAAVQWYVNAKQLQFEPLMTESIGNNFYNTLSYNGYIDDRGIMLANDFSFSDISGCFVCEEMSFANQHQLRSVCKVGKETMATSSHVLIPFNPNNGVAPGAAWNGSVCLWFKYDGKQTATCTLYSLRNTDHKANITSVQVAGGNIVLTTQNDKPVTVYKLPAAGQWHFLVISYKEKLISLDNLPPVTNLSGLIIPPTITCAVAIGQTTDSLETGVAELRLFDDTVAAADIVKDLFPTAQDPSNPIKGNTNYWPLNEGQHAETAKDIAGDIDGKYQGATLWNIIYNTAIPDGFAYLDANGNLTDAFDPAGNDPADQPFVELWKTIVNLRNILNKTIGTQKQGALQKLSDYYQLNKDLAVYADYTAAKEAFPHYVQTLLAYRFNLSWPQFSFDLDRNTPFISSYLVNQFDANDITISENAAIARLTDEDGNPAEKWLITESADDVYFLAKREDALDIYKLLPGEPVGIFLADDSFPADARYRKFNIDQRFHQGKATLYFSDSDGQFAVLLKKGDYVRLGIYELPGTGKDVVSQISTFISDLGQLLFTAKTLKLSNDEFKCIADNPGRFFAASDMAVDGAFSLAQIRAIALFKKLNDAYVEEDMSVAAYFYMPDDIGSLVNYMAKLTGWDAQGLRQLSQWNCLYGQFAAIPGPGNLDPVNASVGAGGNYAIVGYPMSDSVFVYQLEGEKWESLPQLPAPKGTGSFGAAVAIQCIVDDENETLRAIVSDTAANSSAGVVYVYEYNQEKKSWAQPVSLAAPDAAANAMFGSAISVYQDTIAIGASNGGAAKSGNVYIFQYVSNQWAILNISFAVTSGDKSFGSSLGLNDDIIAIGSANNAYIFKIDNANAVPLLPPVPCSSAVVVTNGDFVVMSAMSTGNPGIQYITDIDSGNPSAVQTLSNAQFSGICAIAIEEDTLIVNDSTNTCFVYYIQENNLSFRNSFTPATAPQTTGHPWPIALNDGNLIIGAVQGPQPVMLFYGTKHDIHWFGFADECFALAGKLGVSIGSLLDLTGLAGLSLQVRSSIGNGAPPAGQNRAIYAAYENYAGKLAGALAMGRNGGEWETTFTPLRNKFLEKQRDALAGYMIFSLRNRFTDITNINDLYELLLIDAGSSGCRTISRIKAALNSLQLYIERCRMQLEPHTSIRGSSGGAGDALNAADVEWNWMSHYRIWEANREVFLFPEKYYDPTLRKGKSNAYGDLQNKLSQSNLANDSATEAFQTYFNDLETLTGLAVVNCCMGRISSFVNGRIIIKNTWFIFAKTKNRNEGYYFRTADAILPGDAPDTWINWTNWQQIKVSINADSVACVYASGRPYLFWLEFTKQQVSGTDTTYSGTKTFEYDAKVYYTFRQANGQWVNPHEVPDPANAFDFVVPPGTAKTVQVTLPAKPDLNFLGPILDFTNLSITINATIDNVPAPQTGTIAIDGLLDLYERYMWTFGIDGNDIRKKYVFATAGGASYKPGTGLFSNRNVLNLSSSYTGGIFLNDYFNTWFCNSFTLGTWINGIFSTGDWPIFCTPVNELSNQFNFQVVNGYASFGFGAAQLKSNTQLQSNTWYFIVFRYNAKTQEQSIFINGAPDGRSFNAYNLWGNLPYQFGSNGRQNATGNIADLFTIHAPLEDTEILSIYKQYINIEISDDVENYAWELNGGFDEVQHDKKNALLPSSTAVSFQEAGSGPFANGREVLVLNAGNDTKEFVSLPSHFSTFCNHSFTIGIWVNGSFPTGGDWPILASSDQTPGQAFSLLVRDGNAFIDFYNSGTLGKQPLTAGNWYYLVFTYDERLQTQSIYVNGVFDSSSPSHPAYTGSSILTLGQFNGGYASGQMGNLLLVNEALSASDIQAIYWGAAHPNQPPPPPQNVPAVNKLQEAAANRVQQFTEDLFMGGADYLYGKNSVNISYSDLSAKAPYGKYMWELFYHIPMLIAQLLGSNKKYEDAKRWYEYIFKPTAADKSNDRFWQLGYFRSLGRPEDIVKILTGHSQSDEGQILLYDLDPFDPEAIAYLRPGAFEKKTVINYIRNLVDWGDSLFSEYSWESITQAEMLYVLAKELLGKRPDITGSFTKKIPMTIAEIEKEYLNDIPQFVIDIEDMQPSIFMQVQTTPPLSASVSHFYFGIPENDQLPSIQDLVDTRLYEIRNCLNILGRQQSLALFEPPVNPMALVAAGAAGLNAAGVPIGYAADIPYYRFNTILGYAKSVAERVVDFGRQIIGALEKNDEELLAILRTVQERSILDLTTSVKVKAVEEALQQGQVLDQSLASANERVAFYTRMLAKPVSELEGLALALNLAGTILEVPATGLHIASVAGHLVPTVFGFADGDFSPGGAIQAAATALSTESSIANNLANIASVSASYVRRAEDWDLQLKLVQYESASIVIQKGINETQVQNAQAELAIHHQNITNNDNLQRFYTSKFTNRELYQWMIDQLSSVYYQAFQMSLDLAKKAQVAYQFELNTDESIISYGYWDNTRRGLLAGEKLLSDLHRLEKSYVDNNQRYLEIQKIVSLKDIAVTELDRLVKTGSCRISLTEQLYDWDFPGHYNRKIKSVSITIPAIVGPYQAIKATLVQQSNKVVTRPDLNTVKYLVSKEKVQPPPGNSLRVNWRPNQQIAISKASGDSGLFELNFNDERYLPFEGTGAVSEWQLSIPHATNAFDPATISDVIMYINYTAEDGGVAFAEQVINLPEIKNYNGTLVVSIKQQFNRAWNTFMTTGSAGFSADFQYPFNLQSTNIDDQHIVKINRTADGNNNDIDVNLVVEPDTWQISYSDAARRADLLDLILEIPYTAVLKH